MTDITPPPRLAGKRSAPAAERLAAVVLLASIVASGESASAGVKTLERFHDPVVVPTSFVSALPNRDTSNLRLYRVEDGELEPIPYQFDPADAAGEIDIRKEVGTDFVLDENDELVFMAKDAGDRIAGEYRGPGDVAFEIEAIDPLTGDRGWAYVLFFPEDPPPRSAVHYVGFDAARNEAHAEFYTARYDPVLDQLSGLSLGAAAGGNGQNLLRATRMWGRPTFSLLLAKWSPEFHDRNTHIIVEGMRVGPVRVVRRTRLSIDLGKFFPEIPRGDVDVYYYFSSFSVPARVSIPSVALKVLSDFSFETVSEFEAEAAGMRYWDGANPDGVDLSGDHSGLNLEHDHDWWAVSGTPGSYLQAFLMPEQWKRWGIVRGTVVKPGGDGGAGDDEPAPQAGYKLLNMTNLRKGGTHELRRATVVLPRPYVPGDEADALAMYQHPLRAEVHKLERILAAGPTD